MKYSRLRYATARSVVVLLCAAFIQVGTQVAPASAATPIKPTISSVTSGSQSLTVNMVTSGIDATSWRWSITRRDTVNCANSYSDGVVQSTGSLSSTISITGLTNGCIYSVKVAGSNGVIGDYAEAEKLVGGYSAVLNVAFQNDNGTGTGILRTPFANTCNSTTVSQINSIIYASGVAPGTCNTTFYTGYYSGYIKAPYTGTITFYMATDDAGVLSIQGNSIAIVTANTEATGTFNMVQGQVYRFEEWFHNDGGQGGNTVSWSYSGQAKQAIPVGSFANDPSVLAADGGCSLGMASRCAAGSAYEIKQATGTNTDGQYWISIGGTPTLVYCVMNSSQGGGGWMLAMRGKTNTTTFNYDSSYWTNSTLLNNTYPDRLSTTDTIRNTDAKYAPFAGSSGNQVMVLYPEVSSANAGGAFGVNGSQNVSNVNGIAYGFAWHETFTAGLTWTAYNASASGPYPAGWGGNSYNVAQTNGPSATPSCVNSANTLTYLFANANRCAFRQVQSNYNSSETPYSAVGNNIFFSQTDIRFFGINYGNASTSFISKARLGFGWNENGNGDETSNDGNSGIGLYSTNSTSLGAGTYNGCCSATNHLNPGQTGLSGASDGTTRHLGFELYVRNSVTSPVTGNNLRITAKRSSSTTSGTGFTASGTNGSNTFRLSPLAEGFTINSSTGAITVSEAIGVGTYTETVTVTDTNGVTGFRAVTIQVVADSSDTDSALTFDGSSQYLTTAGTYAPSGDLTYEGWLKPANDCSQSAGNNSPFLTTSFVFFCRSNYWRASFRDSAGNWNEVQLATKVASGAWVHFAIVRSGTTATVYINNQQVNIWVSSALANSWSVPSLYPTASAVYIGGTGATNQYFNGSIDEVKIWDSARTITQIWNGANTYESLASANLVAYWDLNEGSGTSAISRAQRSDATFNLTPNNSQWSSVVTTSISGPYTVVSVPRTIINKIGGWKSPDSVTAISALLVAGGGGGGGGYEGGGGGGGGVIETKVTISPQSIYAIKVGTGGRGATNPLASTSGDTSTAFGLSVAGGGSGGSEFTVSAANTQYAPGGGGSGGGGVWGFYQTGAAGIAGQGNAGGNSINLEGPTCSPAVYAGAGGGGAGTSATGTSPSCTKGGNGGAGKLSAITGTYFGGGGGGSIRSATTSSQLGVGGTGGGGSSSYVGGAQLSATGGAVQGMPNTGGGGGAGNSTDGVSGYGGDGGSGQITFRYITALKPVYTAPTNAYLNVGMTETFTTNVAADSATAVLTRTFRWESTTAGSGGTYSLIKSGTGAANASFSWVPSDTSTSGNNFLYRLIVTDSDTAGLFIQDTSTAVFAVINKTLVFTGSNSILKTVGRSRSESYTTTFGTPTYLYSLSPVSTSFSIDTSTAGSPLLKLSDTITVGTYYETITITDSVSASISIPITIKVSPPPSFGGGELVDTGTVLYLDSGNSNSYPRTGTSISDLSGRGLSANLQANLVNQLETVANFTCAAPAYSSDYLGSFNFTGTSQCGYVSNLGLQASYSAETWVKRSGAQVANGAIITTPYSGAGKQINISIFWTGASTVAAGIYSGSNWYTTPAATINDNTWVHLTATYDDVSKNLSLFVDSEAVTTRIVSVSVTWDTAKLDTGLLIGRKWDSGYYFTGSIGLIRLYNRVLTGAEILQNYNATKSRFLTGQFATTHTQKYGSAATDTFTVTSGSPTITYSYVNSAVNRINSKAGYSYDTSTVGIVTLTLISELPPGTYYDTFTAVDSNGATTNLVITAIIAKADTLTIGFDTSTVLTYNGSPAVTYPKPVFRGFKNSDTATVSTRFASALYPSSGTVPTNADTYTVSAVSPFFTAGLPTYYQAVVYETATLTILQAAQNKLNVSLYGAVVGSPFTITLLGGSDTGTVTESVTAGSSATGCAVNNHILTMNSTTISYCNLLVTKAATQNYKVETASVSVYFMIYAINQPSPVPSSGPGIALSGVTSFTVDPNAAPSISNVQIQTVCLMLGCTSTLQITGSGFGSAYNTDTVVKFWRNKIVAMGGSGSANYVVSDTAISINYSFADASGTTYFLPAGVTTGKIIVVTANGIAISPTDLVFP